METINLELRELDQSSFYPVTLLEVFDNQKGCVASNSFSMAQANFHADAWFRGIYVKDTAVGFVMLKLDRETPDYYLWRLMIDKNFQGKGYGSIALNQIVEFVKQFPEAKKLRTTVEVGKVSPLDFYLNYGFKETGKWEDGEKVLYLNL